jgi:Mg-chelatase subunit ChlD
MESRVVDDRPQDARWIRCAALRLIVADAAAHAPASVYAAATMATLTEARVLAGTLELDDIADLTPLLDEAIPADVREPLRLLWADVCAIADGDEDAMTAAAKRFVELVGSEEESAPLVDDELFDELLRALEAAAVETGERAAEGLDCGPMLLHVECNLDRPEGPKLPLREVFYEAVGDSTVEWGHRTPTTSERNARARIAATLRRARHRDRDVTVVEREGPPGRVKMRVAMRADSQRARGQMVTAMPWRAKRRRVVESPKVRLGTAVDTSGSMAAYCEAISSACWTLTGAVTDTEGRAAAVAFGDEARLVVPAGHAAPRSVYEFDAPGAMEMVADALEILDAELRMAEPGPRIAVVVSDGQWVNPHQRDHADSILARWRAQGVHVICVGVGKHPLPHPADHVCFINDADDLAREISLACAEALKTVT